MQTSDHGRSPDESPSSGGSGSGSGGNAAFSYATTEHSRVSRALIRAIERCGGQRKLARLYESRSTARRQGENFFETAVRLLALDVELDADALAALPRHGPLVVVANHPFGVLDGIVLAWLMLKIRPDAKVLANAVLSRVPEARDTLLPVDFAETDVAWRTNLSTRRQAARWLEEGHAIGIFPGGGIATSETWSGERAFDLPWAPFVAKLVKGSGATVAPVYFSGQNSRLFQIASHLSLTLRLSLIMRETARRIGAPMRIAVGDPVGPAALAGFATREALLGELRRLTYALAPGGGEADWTRNGRIRAPRRSYPPAREARLPAEAA